MNPTFVVVGNVSLDFHCASPFEVFGRAVCFASVHPPLVLQTQVPIFAGGKLALE